MNHETTNTLGRSLPGRKDFENILSVAFQNQQYTDWLRGLKSQPEQELHPERIRVQDSRMPPVGTRAALALMAEMEPRGAVVSFSPPNLKSRARQWIEWLKVQRPNLVLIGRQLATHRGRLYLWFAAALLGSVAWRVAADNPALAGNAVRNFSSTSREALALLGLQPPASPTQTPKPEVRVWVDFPSGVYYCPGARRYGKTKDGKFTTESNARLSQYQPASRKCD